ncbi:hypothetical protein pb186bvf_019740 [Paramecium bursaria]
MIQGDSEYHNLQIKLINQPHVQIDYQYFAADQNNSNNSIKKIELKYEASLKSIIIDIRITIGNQIRSIELNLFNKRNLYKYQYNFLKRVKKDKINGFTASYDKQNVFSDEDSYPSYNSELLSNKMENKWNGSFQLDKSNFSPNKILIFGGVQSQYNKSDFNIFISDMYDDLRQKQDHWVRKEGFGQIQCYYTQNSNNFYFQLIPIDTHFDNPNNNMKIRVNEQENIASQFSRLVIKGVIKTTLIIIRWKFLMNPKLNFWLLQKDGAWVLSELQQQIVIIINRVLQFEYNEKQVMQALCEINQESKLIFSTHKSPLKNLKNLLEKVIRKYLITFGKNGHIFQRQSLILKQFDQYIEFGKQKRINIAYSDQFEKALIITLLTYSVIYSFGHLFRACNPNYKQYQMVGCIQMQPLCNDETNFQHINSIKTRIVIKKYKFSFIIQFKNLLEIFFLCFIEQQILFKFFTSLIIINELIIAKRCPVHYGEAIYIEFLKLQHKDSHQEWNVRIKNTSSTERRQALVNVKMRISNINTLLQIISILSLTI